MRFAPTSVLRATVACSLGAAVFASAPIAYAADPPTFADRSGEDDADRKACILLDALAAGEGVYGVEADWVLGGFVAIAGHGGVELRGGSVESVAGAGVVLFPAGGALRGPYVEARLEYARPLSDPTQTDWNVGALAVAATGGWQWTWDYGLSLRIGGGVADWIAAPSVGSDGLLALGVRPVVDGAIGWAF